MARILAVGNDAALLYTRALVLEQTRAFVQTALPSLALRLLDNCSFNLVVICHSVRHHEADEIADRVHVRQPACRVLRLGPQSLLRPAIAQEEHLELHTGPRALVLTASRLLQEENKTGVVIEAAVHPPISPHLHQLRQLQRQGAPPESLRIMPFPHREQGRDQGEAER